MVARALPFVLALAIVGADGQGRHSLALALLLCAIPAAGAAALAAFGDALDGICGGTRPFLAALALLLLVTSAALRSPAVVGGVPALALSAVVGAAALYTLQGTAAFVVLVTSAPSRAARATGGG
jgi:hypothetical protein